MKKISKILSVLLVAAVFAVSMSAEEKSGRFIEVKTNVPVTLTNNTLSLLDFFVPEVVLDLGEIADRMPSDGFIFSAETKPSLSVTAALPVGPKFGVDAGVDIYTKLGLSKSLFDFIGNGNTDPIDITEKLDAYGDVFGYVQANLAWQTKKLSWCVSPSIYTTFLHASSNGSYVRAYNDEDGNFGYDLNGIFDIYSVLPVSQEMMTAEYWQNVASYSPELWSCVGFDISGSASYPVTDMITVSGTVRIPVVPSHINQKTTVTATSSFETSVNQIADGTMTTPAVETNIGESVATNYSINRPLKLDVRGDIELVNGLVDCYAGAGIGYTHPFSKIKSEQAVYADYLLGAQINLINMLRISLQHDYTDQIFSNTLELCANLKFVEIDLGASLSSSSFISSFRGDGFGAYVTFCVGL